MTLLTKAFFLPSCSFSTLLRVWEEMRRIEVVPHNERTVFERLLLRAGRSRWYEACSRRGGGIDFNVSLGRDVTFAHGFNGVHIASGVKIGDRCTIMHGVTIGMNVDRHGRAVVSKVPIVGSDVFLGAASQIIGSCTIGDGARIGAGVVLVNVDIPSGATIVNKTAYNMTNKMYVYPQI